ncbi:BCCT family transporter [Sedimentibacter sp.]|uniref:BCCT family transporter n=1 Tax=Sedimentibacter sp. TaxID=1960295 RepID=UPI00289B087D|nr:BCCT family transporter [Sedimentibacter sp.]
MSSKVKSLDKVEIRKIVFIPMVIIYAVIIVLGVVSPASFASAEGAIVNFAGQWFGWLYDLVALAMMFICIWMLFSKKYGDIVLGGKDAKPIMSKWNWFVISLCGGIATGIVFWGIAEPLTHLMSPIPGFGYEAASKEGALYSLSTSYMHWGPALYAFYCVAGIGIGYAVYNMKLPYRVSSCLYPVLGSRVNGVAGDIVDILCLFGLAGGVSASLGVASMQLGSGMNLLFGIQPTTLVWGIILLAIVVTFIVSSYTGIDRGVRFLSDKNAKIYIGLMIFVLLFGPTKYILNMTVEAMGFHLSNYFTQATYLGTFEGDQWPIWWTINYWSFMIAYTPLIGMFLAKIAVGRTLKEFTLFNFLLPGMFGVIWFGIFGSSAINLQMNGAQLWEGIQSGGLESAVFNFFANFPLSKLLSALFMITAFLSVVTLADSMTTTVSSLSINIKNNSTIEPPKNIKMFWGIVMSSVAFINIATAGKVGVVSGIDATKQLAIVSAFPLLFVVALMVYSTVKMLIKFKEYDVVDSPGTAIVDKNLIED